MFLIIAGLAALTALIYGVFAGRHDAPPAPTIIALKTQVERTLGLSRQWRRAFHEDATALSPVPCPTGALVILTGGQSNAANALSDPVDADPESAAYMTFKGQCYRLQDPVLGATGTKGSLWTALGQALSRELDRPVVFINTAVTASTYSAWLDERSGYFARLETAIANAAAIGLTPDLILWHQGESVAHRQVDQEAFQRPLAALLDKLHAREELENATLLLYRVSRCTGARQAGNSPLIAAQTELATHLPWVIAGPNTDTLGPRDRHDGCHFNGRGRDKVIEMTVAALKQALDG
ncbi:MAG: sialate O-acetylesterase [Pseudomonadota bacterium]